MNDIKGIIEDVEKSDLVSDKVIKKVIEIIGQEKWQDINDEKSDICTTTGELVITLKRIPDLEEENEELKAIQRMALYSKLSDQLANANGLILELSSCLESHSNNNYEYELLQKAEQFLKADVGTKNYEEQDKILKTRLL